MRRNLPRHRPALSVRPAAVLFLLLALLPGARPAAAQGSQATPRPVRYVLSAADPGSHRFHVSVTPEGSSSGIHDFCIPAWTPGYYQLLSYEQSISRVRALGANGQPLIVTHPSPRSWRVQTFTPLAEPVTLTYDVKAEDGLYGFFGSELRADDRTGYVNGASALMYLPDRLKSPASLDVVAPRDWKVACPLTPAGPAPTPDRSGARRTFRFSASGYDELIDGPIQMGSYDEIRFQGGGVPCSCVVVGKAEMDRSRLTTLLTRLVREETSVFSPQGRAAPFPRYIFFYHIGGGGFEGGLEHRSSTIIHLNQKIGSADSDSFVTVTAHELFHAWNVKRIRPLGLGPFDYSGPVRSPSIWFAEGVTDYYASLIPLRLGLRNRDWFLADMASRIGELDSTPSRKRISLQFASLHAWEGGSEGFGGLSYYTKGSLVALYFDLRIRAITDGKRGLDDVLRYLDARFGATGAAYPPTAIPDALNEVSGADLRAEYARYVEGTAEIDWDSALAPLGMRFERRPADYIGIRAEPEGGRVVVGGVDPGSPAERMGIRTGDRIMDIDSVAIDTSNFGRAIDTRQPNSPIRMHVQRNGTLIALRGESGQRFADERIEILPAAATNPRMRRLRDALLQSDRALADALLSVMRCATF
jgi:predicted metalloprotease with PDZ domain